MKRIGKHSSAGLRTKHPLNISYEKNANAFKRYYTQSPLILLYEKNREAFKRWITHKASIKYFL